MSFTCKARSRPERYTAETGKGYRKSWQLPDKTCQNGQGSAGSPAISWHGRPQIGRGRHRLLSGSPCFLSGPNLCLIGVTTAQQILGIKAQDQQDEDEILDLILNGIILVGLLTGLFITLGTLWGIARCCLRRCFRATEAPEPRNPTSRTSATRRSTGRWKSLKLEIP